MHRQNLCCISCPTLCHRPCQPAPVMGRLLSAHSCPAIPPSPPRTSLSATQDRPARTCGKQALCWCTQAEARHRASCRGPGTCMDTGSRIQRRRRLHYFQHTALLLLHRRPLQQPPLPAILSQTIPFAECSRDCYRCAAGLACGKDGAHQQLPGVGQEIQKDACDDAILRD